MEAEVWMNTGRAMCTNTGIKGFWDGATKQLKIQGDADEKRKQGKE